ncbi:MAG TPA: glycosyl hydrolase family 28-related protein [Tepidisphaeraceae bacterium]
MSRLLFGLLALLALIQRAGATTAGRGAMLPWITYEAEQAKTTGSILGPDYIGHTPAREASSRRCVSLAATGQFLEFTASADANGMVVRYCIPDSPDGRGADATLSLSINGKPSGKLAMTSRYSYLYGEYPFSNDPSAGTPRHFWDELRLMPSTIHATIHAGDVIRLQKNADDIATQYLIDFVDLEAVPAPLEKPADALSITDFGATPNNQSDARPAFVAAIAAAKSQHKTVWIPAGQFMVKGPLEVSDVAIRGAGMWYSTLVGADNYSPENRVAINGNGSNIILSDFAIIGKLNYRNDSEANDGLGGSFGAGSSIRNIWVEHTKTGAWLVNSDGLLVEGCRFRDTIADGINLCVGMHNTTVRNCTVRGGGDDCFAMWPATYAKSLYHAGSNRFINCTAQFPSLAQGFSIYGGEGNSVENCTAIDIPYGAGLLASTMFPTEFGFGGITTYRHIDITRAGDSDGAIAVMTNLADLAGLRFDDIEVIDSPRDGIKFNSIKDRILGDTAFDQIHIVNAGLAGSGSGIVEAKSAVGSATISNVSVINPKTVGWQNNDSAFNLIRGAGNSGVDDKDQSSADLAAARRASVVP